MNTLSLLTRWPEAGKTKTRLIPALGAKKAAELQRRLTKHALVTAEPLTKLINAQIEIVYQGGNLAKMEAWLGKEHNCIRQAQGDLGMKIGAVFKNNLKSREDKNIVIGGDCPQIKAEILAESFQRLERCDLVLGPATDGGYYCVGLKKFYPQLFLNIPWGSDEVFEKTMAEAEKLKLDVYCPPKLSDIDRPEDLKLLKRDFKHILSGL